MTGKDFEKKIDNAKGILEKLMDPELTLSDSVRQYKKGMEELRSAQKMLEDARIEFETIRKEHDSNPGETA